MENSCTVFRQRGPQRDRALNTVSQPGWSSEEFHSNCSRRVWPDCGHSFWLVGGEVSGSGTIIPSGSNQSGLRVCGQVLLLTVNFSYLIGASVSVKQRYFCLYPLRGNHDPSLRLHNCFPWLYLPYLASPPSLINNHFNLPLDSGEVMKVEWSLFPNERNGWHRRRFCAQESHTQGPADISNNTSGNRCSLSSFWPLMRMPTSPANLIALLTNIFQLYLLFESYLANKLHAYLLILCYTSNFK